MRKALEKHLKENIKDYFICGLIIIIGIFLGTMVLNNSGDSTKQEISDYLNEFNLKVQDGQKIDYSNMIFEIMKKDAKLILLVSFLSISVIGIIGTYLIVGYKGFCIGYTISSIVFTFGIGKGLAFSLSLMLLSKIIELPAIFFLIISGRKMYKMILEDRSKENVKYAITKYIINALIAFSMFTFSALVETYLSSNLFLSIIKYV